MSILYGLIAAGVCLAIGFWVGWRQGLREGVPLGYETCRGLVKLESLTETLEPVKGVGPATANVERGGLKFTFTKGKPPRTS